MSRIFNQTIQKEKRRKLRNSIPQAETILWFHLRNRQIKNYKFRRQYSVGKYVLDFYCPTTKLAIEVDGDTHYQEKGRAYDRERQKYIEQFGIHFLRFTNREIYKELTSVLEKIFSALSKHPTPPLAPPLLKGRGK